MGISGSFLYFTSSAFVFLMEELIEWSLLVHDLRLPISAFKAACIIFAISLVVAPFVLPELWSRYVVSLVSVSQYWILLFCLSITFSFLWIWHHIVGKKTNSGQVLLAIASAAFLILYIAVNLIPYVSG
jgi:hypothetical protein